jgi:magnesium transporter
LISAEVRVYLRDCYDHAVQVIDMVETYRELASSLMDVYLSSVSNRMNEIMKTLTVISAIFIPLTFVAGIYGMNFNTEMSPWNMPELNWYWGYPACLALMVAIAGVLVFFFWRRGWFDNISAVKSDKN